ncbi:MAG: 5'-nucleotidase C-terminal domain-containing protein [Anaerolineae bacterium]|nr:5'-nucleotidase C-terminal domain-containing protein [Anaerolineae bacterium]
MRSASYTVLLIIVVLSMVLGTVTLAAPETCLVAPTEVATITILHTNDFHGNLQPSGSNPGMARTAQKIEDVRTAVGAENVLLVDAGDLMQGTLLSNLFHGESTIDIYNLMGYEVVTFGNHEFDWGQAVLTDRTTQSNFPWISANIVVNDTGDCATAGWTPPPFAASPWMTMTVGAPGNEAVIGLIGVTTQETPYITVDWATEGLCFKDPTESIGHYWAELDAASDAIVVLSHLGYTDGGYGYGFPVYGDQTLAHNLFLAGTPVDLIIGGHSHTDLSAATIVDGTTVVQAHYAGRKVGKATLVIDKATGDVDITWERIVVGTGDPENPAVKAAIEAWANDPWYQEQINRVVGFTNVEIVRNYNGDSLMGAFVNDAIYNDLNNDDTLLNDVDMVFNNPGGLRADITFPTTPTLPYTLTHGMMYSVLPFGNATIVGDMTGAQIIELLNQSATLFKGALQVAGVRHDFYRYSNALPGPQPWAWGAFNIMVYDRAKAGWEPIDPGRTYRIATNEFLAPAGQDGFVPFKYLTNTSYWGDMLDGVERWVSTAYTKTSPYEGTLDGRITRDGDDTTGGVVAVTLLHNNDTHGNLLKGTYVGLTQLASLVNQERAKNPDRSLLLNAGDTIQGDAMSYYFKSAPTGFAADGTPIADPAMHIQPSIAAMNAMAYDAMTVGNHEFNFGNAVFVSVLQQAAFPMLGAVVSDDGSYGLDQVPILPSIQRAVPGPYGDIDLAILGLDNHRIPYYELPSNIPGLSFANPISKAQELVPALAAASDAVVALTHLGFTTIAGSLEVDNNVDTYLAANVSDIDVIIGGHSHTDPSKQTLYSGAYKYLPAIIGAPDGDPVLVTQAYRYCNYLGQVVLGFVPNKDKSGYDLMSSAGRYIAVTSGTPEDPTILDIVQPYADMLAAYNSRELGLTTVPIDALQAYTQETNAANLQADASVWELAQNGIEVDFHLSGAMSNRKVADSATPSNPYTLTVANMFTLMPYENSLVAMEMNGPQLKAVLERSYRNYYYYKYVPGYGGYSHYTTCFLDTDTGNEIWYYDGYPMLPNGHNVAALKIGGAPVDFDDAGTYYTVSTVNYLAAGSCNFRDEGVTLWPLDQIVEDTQFYVRDAVINYVADQGTISPAIEGRIQFLAEHFFYLPIVAKH